MNLIEGLQKELERNKKLLKIYEEIPIGVFVATIIRKSIKKAERAMAVGDTVEMLKYFKNLKKNK